MGISWLSAKEYYIHYCKGTSRPCLLFVILFQYDKGWNIITKCFEKERKENTGNQGVQQGFDVPGLLEVLESLLTFDAWLRKSDYWSTTDPRECNRVMKDQEINL